VIDVAGYDLAAGGGGKSTLPIICIISGMQRTSIEDISAGVRE
jgi:hypothetical protein